MYNPNYDKLPPQQGWQCPLCHMVWAPSIVSCACNKNEVGNSNTTTSILNNTSILSKNIDYPEAHYIAEEPADCNGCIRAVYTMLTPLKDGCVYGGTHCSVLGKNNPTKDECPGKITSI